MFDCTFVRICNASGACSTESGKATFRLEPIAVQKDGSGRYSIRYEKNIGTVQALSQAGPFWWTMDDARNTLIASSEHEFLWHRLLLGAVPLATVRFMTCTVSE